MKATRNWILLIDLWSEGEGNIKSFTLEFVGFYGLELESNILGFE